MRAITTPALAFALASAGCSNLGFDNTRAASCPQSPAGDVFDATVCICEDFRDIGNLIVGSSTGDPAVLAVNGSSVALNNTDVRGSYVAYGGLEARANVMVDGTLSSAATVDALGNVDVGEDLEVGGDLTGIGRLAVDGALRVGGADRFLGYKEIGSVESYGSTPAPPCGCGDDQILDVAAAVDAARASNDNAAAGLDTDLENIGVSILQLGSGEYYFDEIRTIGATKLIIDGTVSIYLGGNLENIGAEWIRLMPGATLDLFVAGAVRTIGHVDLGDRQAPMSFRLYIGGAEDATINVGNQLYNGSIYAPRADVHYIGNTNVRGAIFAKNIKGTGNLVVGHAAPQEPPSDCDPPDSDTPDDEPPPPPDDGGEPAPIPPVD